MRNPLRFYFALVVWTYLLCAATVALGALGADPAPVVPVVVNASPPWFKDPAITAMVYALSTGLIGFLVRALKDDSFVFPGKAMIPTAFRPVFALGLGGLLGGVDAWARGTYWRDALLLGLTAAFTAMLGHNLVVDVARDGRDIGVKPEDKPVWIKVAPEADLAKTPPKGSPKVPPMLMLCLAAVVSFLVAGCKGAIPVIHTADRECEIIATLSGDPILDAVCHTMDGITTLIDVLIAAKAKGAEAHISVDGKEVVIPAEKVGPMLEAALATKMKLAAKHPVAK